MSLVIVDGVGIEVPGHPIADFFSHAFPEPADLSYGRVYAGAVPGAQFHLLAGTGHLPRIESPDALTPLLGL